MNWKTLAIVLVVSIAASTVSYREGFARGVATVPTPAELSAAVNQMVQNAVSLDDPKPCAQTTGSGSAAVSGNGNTVTIDGTEH